MRRAMIIAMESKAPVYVQIATDPAKDGPSQLLRFHPDLPLSGFATALLIITESDTDPEYTMLGLAPDTGLPEQLWTTPSNLALGIVEQIGIPGMRPAEWDTVLDAFPAPGTALMFAGETPLFAVRVEVSDDREMPAGLTAQLIEQINPESWGAPPRQRLSARRRRYIDGANAAFSSLLHAPPVRIKPARITEESAGQAVAAFRKLLELIPVDGLPMTQFHDFPDSVLAELEAVLNWPKQFRTQDRSYLTEYSGTGTYGHLYWVAQCVRDLGLVRLAKGKFYRTKTAERLFDDSLGLLGHIISRGWKRSLPEANQYASFLYLCALGEGRPMPRRDYAAKAAVRLIPPLGLNALPRSLALGLALAQATHGRLLFELLGAWENPWEETEDLIPTPVGVTLSQAFLISRLPQDLDETIEGATRFLDTVLQEQEEGLGSEFDLAAITDLFTEICADGSDSPLYQIGAELDEHFDNYFDSDSDLDND
ncbi:MAG: hypothetical protein LBE08_11065 [Bifidobacteriaceae bacterium]|nr:hypothetical protein [Bifidobacteriaceae bacterium]